MLGAVLLVFAVGLIDDLKRVEPWHKLIGLTIAAFLAYRGGVSIHALAGHRIGYWNLPLSVIWILICSYAINLINSIDALTPEIGVIAILAIFIAALLHHNFVLAVATLPLAASILGFLPFNFHPPTILLGESGSLLIGFMLGCYGILWSHKSGTVLGGTATLLLLSVPFFDAMLIVLRRFLRRQPLGAADMSHLYHRLLRRGLAPHKATLVLYMFSAIGAIVSVVVLNNRSPWVAVLVFSWIAWIWIRHLGYSELNVAGRMLLEGAFLRQLQAELTLQSYESRLKAASTPEEYWAVVEQGLHEFGFHDAQLSIAGSTFVWRHSTLSFHSWELTVPIADADCIRLSLPFGRDIYANGFAPFVDLLRRSLTAKRSLFLSHRRRQEARANPVGA